jgi:hypothetical protein
LDRFGEPVDQSFTTRPSTTGLRGCRRSPATEPAFVSYSASSRKRRGRMRPGRCSADAGSASRLSSKSGASAKSMQLAELSQVSFSTIRRMETEASAVRQDSIEQVRVALELRDVQFLLGQTVKSLLPWPLSEISRCLNFRRRFQPIWTSHDTSETPDTEFGTHQRRTARAGSMPVLSATLVL